MTHWERRSPRPIAYSVALHVGAMCAMALLFSSQSVRRWASGSVRLIVPVDVRPSWKSLQAANAGGSGGTNQTQPQSKGRPPRFQPIPLAAPMALPPTATPILAVEPALLGPEDTPVPKIDMAVLGDPFAAPGPPSGGPGRRGGMGTGDSGGIGDGDGPGVGPGSGIGVFTVGRDGVTSPKLLHRVEPEYSDEARIAKWQGSVKLRVEVWPDGRAHNLRVLRALGMGLDEEAIEAVRKWRFAPGRRNGEAVPTFATIEVRFRLL
ncbi:MAG: energy transducer TonB [Bryobacterales bacterium]